MNAYWAFPLATWFFFAKLLVTIFGMG
jgi:hypothetical protein